MDPSRAVAVRRFRTLPRVGWRSDIGAAVALVARRPSLWILGSAGFGLRGGILLLTLPIVVFPTQVEMRFMLGSNLGSTGLTGGFWTLLAILGAVGALLALGALYALAAVEVGAFEQAAEAPETADQRGWRASERLTARGRRQQVERVFAIEAVGLLLLIACAVPLVAAIGSSTISELTSPSSSDALYVRVLADIRDPLFFAMAALVLIELFSAAAAREVLIRGSGLRGGSSTLIAAVTRPIRSPVRTFVAAALGWLAWLAAIVSVAWLLGVVWQLVTTVFLSTTSLGDVGRDLGLLMVAILLAGVFALGILVCGMVSALRSALWTVEGLR